MNLHFRHRLSLTERCVWLAVVLLFGLITYSHAQTSAPQPVNLSNTPGRAAHGFTEDNEDYPTRNHGTGVRLGVVWASARTAARAGRVPAIFEVGGFHQRAVGRVGSVQAEALFFRQSATGATAAATGLRLPVLLVLNPFDNVSIHVGPQLQWQRGGAPVASERATRPTAAISGSLAAGGEARVGFLRVGLRYAVPLRQLNDLAAIGQQAAADWHAGQVQVYLGAGFDR